MKFLLFLLVAFVNTAPAPTYVTPQAATNIALSLLPSVGGTVIITNTTITNVNALHFDANQFGVSGTNIQIKSGTTITNPVLSDVMFSGYLASDDDLFGWNGSYLQIQKPLSSADYVRIAGDGITFTGPGGVYVVSHTPVGGELVWKDWVTANMAPKTNAVMYGDVIVSNTNQVYTWFHGNLFEIINNNTVQAITLDPASKLYSDPGFVSGRTNGWTNLVVASPKFGFWRSNDSIYCTMTLPGSPYYTNKLVVP